MECTQEGHLVGMLDRDQRTAKISFVCRQHRISECAVTFSKSTTTTTTTTTVFRYPSGSRQLLKSCGAPRKTVSDSRNPCKNGHFWKSLLRIKQLFVVGVYLSLVTFPLVTSAPANRQSMASRLESHPKWINPCGTNLDDLGPHGLQTIDDENLLMHIVNQATIAFTQAELFKDKFAKKTFKFNSSQDLHNSFKDQEYDWLPTKSAIPKKLGEVTSKEHLESLELNTALLNAYEGLQKIAVGLEQVVWDQEDHNGDFKVNFNSAQYELRNVLCEIQNMIIERNITMRPDVTRDIMPEDIRNGDDTARYMRDWLIYRSYLTTLEYIIDVFGHFQRGLSNNKQ